MTTLFTKKAALALFFWFGILGYASGQNAYWQQKAAYEIAIDFDVNTHRYTGTQKLKYTNNSPDTLTKVFYHLFLNAFQPGSQMDVRSRTIADPDARVGDRIAKLAPDEIGYQKIQSLAQNGKPLKYEVQGTILEVKLDQHILPGSSHIFDMKFEAQVPLQIRRTGRNSKEGIEYSMSQWYPKISEYDREGWHANPYIAREFHGVWGDFDVKITIDSRYTIGGTGYLQNADKIGHGYTRKNVSHKPGSKLTWHFKAPNVHDFVWAADPDYNHDIVKVDDNLELHFFYQNDSSTTATWKDLQSYAVQCFQILNKRYGRYPYKQYSIIQGGDGGMEYPMATLITGNRNLRALVSVTVHEAVHSWFQLLLATNESKYAWMDEGFTNYAQGEVMAEMFPPNIAPHAAAYSAYRNFALSGEEEPMTTHADHYNSNRSYSIGSYIKGSLFLPQLSYIIGKEAVEAGMKRYFNEWKFKHPTPTDLKRVMEKVSGIELDWYFEYWVETTKTIDYGIKQVVATGSKTKIVLEKIGHMPMPLDVVVTYQDGTQENFYIPLEMMRGEKKETIYQKTTLLSDWPWVYPQYEFEIDHSVDQIKQVRIDPSNRMADLWLDNNIYPTAEDPTPRMKGERK